MIYHSRPSLDSKDALAVSEVVTSGYIAQSGQTRSFENEVALFIGSKGGVAVSSGIAALHLSLLSLNISKGDEVALPSFVCAALLHALNYVQATPLFIDILPESLNIDPNDLKKKITSKTKAVIVPHMFGLAADLEPILACGLPVIEDCAQSIGAEYKGKKVGSFGVSSVFSFYATKVIACGEGGMILSNSTEILQKTKKLREYDKRDSYEVAFNYKMSDLHAALGRSQLKKLPDFVTRRKAIAEEYFNAFSDLSATLPLHYKDTSHIYFRFILSLSGNVEEAINALRSKNIVCERPVYKPLHQYVGKMNLPVTESCWNKTLSIPIYPAMTQNEINTVIDSVRSVFSK